MFFKPRGVGHGNLYGLHFFPFEFPVFLAENRKEGVNYSLDRFSYLAKTTMDSMRAELVMYNHRELLTTIEMKMEQLPSQDITVFILGFVVGAVAFAALLYAAPFAKKIIKSGTTKAAQAGSAPPNGGIPQHIEAYIKTIENHTDINLYLIETEEGQKALKRFFVSEHLLGSELETYEKSLLDENEIEEFIKNLDLKHDAKKKSKGIWERTKDAFGKTKDKTLSVLNKTAKSLAGRFLGDDD